MVGKWTQKDELRILLGNKLPPNFRCYADKVMERVFAELGQSVPGYDSDNDPTKSSDLVEWTQSVANAKQAEILSRKVEQEYKAELKRKKLLKNTNLPSTEEVSTNESKPQVNPDDCGGDAKKPKLDEHQEEVEEKKPKLEKIDSSQVFSSEAEIINEGVKVEQPQPAESNATSS